MILERIRVGVHPYIPRVTPQAGDKVTPTLTERAVEFDEQTRERSARRDNPQEDSAAGKAPKDTPEESLANGQAGQPPEHGHLDLRA